MPNYIVLIIILVSLSFIFLCIFFLLNLLVKRTNAYHNFYRTIHIVKDIRPTDIYKYAAFGSTFSYFAYDLKDYGGHNFSIEPQSLRYMQKTIEHFANNIENGGIAFISITACIFAASSTSTDEECTAYYSFLSRNEFDNYKKNVKIKYYLKRLLPALSPHYLKCLFKDERLIYSVDGCLSFENGTEQAKKRIKGWENVVGTQITDDFSVNENLQKNIDKNINLLQEIISFLKNKNIHPVIVILPVSDSFNSVCPKIFYEKLLYKSLDRIKNETIIDFLLDKEMGNMDYYLSSDCLNVTGRKKLTNKLIERVNQLL